MEHDKCTIYRSYIDSAKLFAKDRAELAEAVLVAVEYALYGIEYDGDNKVALSTYMNSKPLSDAFHRNSDNGTAGGRPSKGSGDKKGALKGGLKRGLKKGACKAGTESDIDKEIDIELDKDLEEDMEIEEKDIASGDASISASNGASNAVEKKVILRHEKSESVDEVVEYYNSRIKETNAKLRFCNTLSPARRGSIGARVDEHGMEKVKEMIDKACVSRFLNHDARSAPVSIDWLFGPQNFPKVLDGNYDNKGVVETDEKICLTYKSSYHDKDFKQHDRSDIDLRLGRDLPKDGYRDSF